MPKASPALMEIIAPPIKIGWALKNDPRILEQIDKSAAAWGKSFELGKNLYLPFLTDESEPVEFVEFAVAYFEKVFHFPMPDYSIEDGQFIIEEL